MEMCCKKMPNATQKLLVLLQCTTVSVTKQGLTTPRATVQSERLGIATFFFTRKSSNFHVNSFFLGVDMVDRWNMDAWHADLATQSTSNTFRSLCQCIKPSNWSCTPVTKKCCGRFRSATLSIKFKICNFHWWTYQTFCKGEKKMLHQTCEYSCIVHLNKKSVLLLKCIYSNCTGGWRWDDFFVSVPSKRETIKIPLCDHLPK